MTLTPKAWLLKAELLRSVALKWMLVAVSTVIERLGLVGDDGAAETSGGGCESLFSCVI